MAGEPADYVFNLGFYDFVGSIRRQRQHDTFEELGACRLQELFLIVWSKAPSLLSTKVASRWQKVTPTVTVVLPVLSVAFSSISRKPFAHSFLKNLPGSLSNLGARRDHLPRLLKLLDHVLVDRALRLLDEGPVLVRHHTSVVPHLEGSFVLKILRVDGHPVWVSLEAALKQPLPLLAGDAGLVPHALLQRSNETDFAWVSACEQLHAA